MKLPCSVIQDLLPLYCDRACSEESRALVNEHLNNCESCRTQLVKMQVEIDLPKETPDPAKPLRGIRSEWLRIKKTALIKGILITLLAVAVAVSGWLGLTEIKLPVDAEKLTISDVSQLSNGVIAFHLLIDDGRELREISTHIDFDDGIAYITPKRALIEPKQFEPGSYLSLNDRYYYVAFAGYTLAQFEAHDYDSMSPLDESLADSDFFFASDIQKICIGTKQDHIVLWEQDMELPTAGEERENIYYSGIR